MDVVSYDASSSEHIDELLCDLLDLEARVDLRGAMIALACPIHWDTGVLAKELVDIGCEGRVVVVRDFRLVTSRPSIVDVFLSLNGIESYGFVTNGVSTERAVDRSLIQTLALIRNSHEKGCLGHLRSSLEKLGETRFESRTIQNAVGFVVKHYLIVVSFLERVFHDGQIASTRELLGTSSDDTADVARLEEFRLIVKNGRMIVAQVESKVKPLGEYLRGVLVPYDLAISTAYTRPDGTIPSTADAVPALTWLAGFLMVHSKSRCEEGHSFVAFLSAFRCLELIGISVLLQFGLAEFVSLNREIDVFIDGQKLAGFGRAWGTLDRKVLVNRNVLTAQKRSSINYLIRYRNKLLVTHGIRYVNPSIAGQLIDLVDQLALDLEAKLGSRSMNWSDTKDEFERSHFLDPGDMIYRSLVDAAAIEVLDLREWHSNQAR